MAYKVELRPLFLIPATAFTASLFTSTTAPLESVTTCRDPWSENTMLMFKLLSAAEKLVNRIATDLYGYDENGNLY